MNDLTK